MGETVLEREDVKAWEVGLRALHERIAGRFGRREPRQRVLAYLKGLLGSVERKNGWQLAEYAGDATPDGLQRLLATYRWDAEQVRDDLGEYVVEHLGDPEAVLVVDETGFLKQGNNRWGYSGNTAVRLGRSRTARLGCFWPMGADMAGPFWIGSCTCPRSGRRTGATVGSWRAGRSGFSHQGAVGPRDDRPGGGGGCALWLGGWGYGVRQ